MPESYASLAHLAWNVKRPQSEWLNMGDWSHTQSFPEACEALARRLQEAAQIPEQARVLDVGHGCGDSLLMLLQRNTSYVHGVTSLHAHAARAQARCGSRAKVHCLDATEYLSQTQHTYDTILALDCAYHFDDRARFFREAYDALAPGGKLALVDLLAAYPYPSQDTVEPSRLPAPRRAPSLWRRFMHSVVCFMSGTQPKSFVSFETYREQLSEAKFCTKDIEMHDISADVFPGFANFLQNLNTGEQRAWQNLPITQTGRTEEILD
ncbi:hypothetical protein MPSI1_000052 [Malassezia psittaci]|uniref:phosphoethanolamine N-methyltransferase n=1 Tax=Malassezia psittaci TaxID=1821823 RepID=A0AAF0F248_9BASI|nr:hypothetical protein MPSI1_000052 [Malassezia psittaci]